MIAIISEMLRQFDKKQKRKFFTLIFISILSTMADVFGIASFMPFMAVVANPTALDGNYWFDSFKGIMEISDNQQLLLISSYMLMFVLLVSFTIKAFFLRRQIQFSLFLEQELSDRLVLQYLNKKYDWFLDKNTSDIGKTVMSEVNHVVNGLVIPVVVFITQLIACLTITVLLLLLDPYLTLASGLALAVVYGSLVTLVRKYLQTIGEKTFRANKLRFKFLSEAFGAIRDVKLLQLQGKYSSDFSRNAKIYFENLATSQIISQVPRFVVEALAFCGMLLAIQYLLMQKGTIQAALPIVSGFAFAIYRLMPAIQQLYSNYAQAQHSLPAARSLFGELKSTTISVQEELLLPKKIPFKENITLRDVTFHYHGSTRKILTGLNLNIKKGEFIGIIGSSGVGKSTVLDIVSGLLEPTSGTMKVDGASLNSKNLPEWQPNIGYVSQHVYLTDDTIAKNIALSEQDDALDLDRVKRVSKLAKLDEFIENDLKGDYHSVVGERGGKLSGGQKQRIGIARALYRNPSLLIFDEATSALDPSSSQFIMNTVYELKGLMTAVLVSHDAELLRHCDSIYSLNDGLLLAAEKVSFPNKA
ncbi:ATP-binding cassette domain-containing protein [Paracoccaceae bacterium]|nr:ATP-binding cassette domain-containing protein [Paracoccaceae bacterium]